MRRPGIIAHRRHPESIVGQAHRFPHAKPGFS
jgi:hypothetical protein